MALFKLLGCISHGSDRQTLLSVYDQPAELLHSPAAGRPPRRLDARQGISCAERASAGTAAAPCRGGNSVCWSRALCRTSGQEVVSRVKTVLPWSIVTASTPAAAPPRWVVRLFLFLFYHWMLRCWGSSVSE